MRINIKYIHHKREKIMFFKVFYWLWLSYMKVMNVNSMPVSNKYFLFFLLSRFLKAENYWFFNLNIFFLIIFEKKSGPKYWIRRQIVFPLFLIYAQIWKKNQRNWVFATKSDFLNPLSFTTQCRRPLIFQAINFNWIKLFIKFIKRLDQISWILFREPMK